MCLRTPALKEAALQELLKVKTSIGSTCLAAYCDCIFYSANHQSGVWLTLSTQASALRAACGLTEKDN